MLLTYLKAIIKIYCKNHNVIYTDKGNGKIITSCNFITICNKKEDETDLRFYTRVFLQIQENVETVLHV